MRSGTDHMANLTTSNDVGDGLKHQAERLRTGILGGWLPVSAAVAWADILIAQAESPIPALLEISLAGQCQRGEMGDYLSAVPGTADPIAVTRSCLADLLEWMGADPERGEQVAHHLYSLAANQLLPEDVFGAEAYLMDERFAFARSGTYGSLPEAHRFLAIWLHSHSAGEVT